MQELMQWFSMGGYGSYVWSAYGLVIGMLCVNAVGCHWQKKRIDKSLQTWFKQLSRR